MNLTNEYKLKQFLAAVYEPIIVQGNNLKDGEEICVAIKNSENFMNQYFFNNIDDLILFLRNNIKKVNYSESYFNLYTTTGQARKKDNIKTATCIGLDYDQKDFQAKGIELNIDYIQGMFNEYSLYYNALINSGNGFHVYIMLEPTTNIELVTEVSKKIAELTGADHNACKPTQLLRIPFTYNNKGDRKIVNIVWKDEHIKRKNIDYIAKKVFQNNSNSGTTKTFKGTSCKRIEDLTTIPCTNRHDNLLWLYGKLLQFNNTEGQIQIKLDEFQKLNKLEDWEYQLQYLKENGKPVSSCEGCQFSAECKNYVVSDFDYSNGTWLPTTETTIKKCNKKNKKGGKQMTGNMLVIYALLKVYYEGITQSELLTQLSKNEENKPCISKPTLIKCLKEMEEMELIEVKTDGKKKLYKLNSKVDNTKHEQYKFSVNYALANAVINDLITAEDMRLYCFMRYLHNVENRTTGKKEHKGNVFVIRQTELAKEYGEDQGNISRRIQRLLDHGILGMHYRGISKYNSKEYYVYKLLM